MNFTAKLLAGAILITYKLRPRILFVSEVNQCPIAMNKVDSAFNRNIIQRIEPSIFKEAFFPVVNSFVNSGF